MVDLEVFELKNGSETEKAKLFYFDNLAFYLFISEKIIQIVL